MEILFQIPGTDDRYAGFKISYDKGGPDFSMKMTRRGVYLVVTPFKKDGGCREFGIFNDPTGFGMAPFKVLLKELGRKSKKQEERFFGLLKEKEKEIREMVNHKDIEGIKSFALSLKE